MPDIDWHDLTLEELKTLEKDVAKAIKSYEARNFKEARAAAEAAARDFGFSLADLVGGAPVSAKSVTPPKYRHPENPALTWSGRGRKPKWFTEALANGTAEDDLLI